MIIPVSIAPQGEFLIGPPTENNGRGCLWFYLFAIFKSCKYILKKVSWSACIYFHLLNPNHVLRLSLAFNSKHFIRGSVTEHTHHMAFTVMEQKTQNFSQKLLRRYSSHYQKNYALRCVQFMNSTFLHICLEHQRLSVLNPETEGQSHENWTHLHPSHMAPWSSAVCMMSHLSR